MTVEYMRNRINEAYDGRWLAIHSMPDNQIIAIYYSMKEKGKFDIKKHRSTLSNKTINKERAVQLSIFDMPEYLQSIGK